MRRDNPVLRAAVEAVSAPRAAPDMRCRGVLDCTTELPTRRYLNWWACPEHTPAKMYGHPEQPEPSYPPAWLSRPSWTRDSTKGSPDINKTKPGGYLSKQRAAKEAAARDAARKRAQQQPTQT